MLLASRWRPGKHFLMAGMGRIASKEARAKTIFPGCQDSCSEPILRTQKTASAFHRFADLQEAARVLAAQPP